MPLTTTNKILITTAVIILVVGGLILAVYRSGEAPAPVGDGVGGTGGEVVDPATVTVEGGTRGVLPSGSIDIPEPIEEGGEQVTQRGDEAVPITTISTPETDNTFRHFELKGEGNKYSPSKITVREGDIVDIGFTAVDRAYTFFIPDFGIYQLVEKGEKRTIQFQAYPYGTYAFSCKDVCDGFSMLGTLVVVRE